MALGLTGAGDITGGTFNRPLLRVHLSANQSIGDNVTTTIQFDQVSVDTNSCYSTSPYKFTPNVAGYYYIHCQAHMGQDGGSSDVHFSQLNIQKNGNDTIASSRQNPANDAEDQGASHACSTITYMNGTTDYVLANGRVDCGTSQPEIFYGSSAETTQLSAFRLHA